MPAKFTVIVDEGTVSGNSYAQWLKENWRLVAAVSGGAVVIGGIALYWRYGRKPGAPTAKITESETVSEAVEQEVESTAVVETEAQDEARESQVVEVSEQKIVDVPETQEVQAAEEEESTIAKDELAQLAKTQGNEFYAAKQYKEAIAKYTEAIELQGAHAKPSSIYYGNRAACHAALNETDAAIRDCDLALVCDPTYLKAVMRRALINEKAGRLSEALDDYTTALIFENFQGKNIIDAADRILRTIAKEKASEMFETDAVKKRVDLPSMSFVQAYNCAFSYEYGNVDDVLHVGVKEAVVAYQTHDYHKAYWRLVSCDIEQIPHPLSRAIAYNMIGTFTFLIGHTELAKDLLLMCFEITSDGGMSGVDGKNFIDLHINTLIKLSGVQMEARTEEATQLAMPFFENGKVINDKDADLHYHYGQMCFLMEDFKAAKEAYTTALALYPPVESKQSFTPASIYCRIQKAMAEYRNDSLEKSLKMFQNLQKQYPWCADVWYYHGEVLLDSQRIDQAVTCFDRAIQLDPKLPLPYLNKAIIATHVKQNAEEGLKLTQQVLAIDPQCELAHIHLAQHHLNKGEMDEAVAAYGRAISLARNVGDAENGFMGMEAAKAQKNGMDRVMRARKLAAAKQ